MATLIEKIEAYEKRAQRDGKKVKMFPYDREGVYEFIGGSESERGERKSVGLYRGRFIDVILMAFEHPKFEGWYCPADPGNVNCGYITEYAPPKIVDITPNPDIIDDIKSAKELETRVKRLQDELTEKHRR